MKCLLCGKWSWKVLCPSCLKWLKITPQKRELGGLVVYSFYDFDEVRECLHSKYAPIGSKVMTLLAQKAALYLAGHRELKGLGLSGVALDDEPKEGYSHTAIIARAFKMAGIVPVIGALRATHSVKYAGKSLEFRQQNPRGFCFDSSKKIESAVLIDDLVTTGSTMLEAKKVLEREGVEVAFGLSLSDARGLVES